jgi:hypothetical protein
MTFLRILFAIFLTTIAHFTFIILMTIMFMNYQMYLKQTEDRLQQIIYDAKQEILSNCEFESASEFTLYAGY